MDQNIFEEIIDKMMADELADKHGFNEEFRQKLFNLPTDKKRMVILSLLDEDRMLFTKIKALTDRNINRMDHIKDVILMLREYVKVGEVEQKAFGEVMTPLELVKEMLQTLPEEVWSDPTLKWLDPANGTGPFPAMVIYKLMEGLKEWEPDDNKRYKHIIENMIYVSELQPKNMFLWLCVVDPFDEYTTNIYTGSFLDEGFDNHMKDVWGIEKFDIVIGNPPYQEMDKGHGASAKALYNHFIMKSVDICDKLIMITPSRWFAGGKGLDKFRKFMMESNKIKMIKHFDDENLFGDGVAISGGISYFLFDNNYNGDCSFDNGSYRKRINLNKYDIINKRIEGYSILEKINIQNNIESISYPRSFYKIATNDNRLKSEKLNDEYIKCFVSQKKGFIKFIKNEFPEDKLNKHKIATPRAYGKPEMGLGNIFYVAPNEVVSDSYMFIEVSNEIEAKSLISYLKTKFVHLLVTMRKIDMSVKPSTLKWIPIVPFDREWTDEQLFEYFNFTEDEIKIILE